MYSWIAILILQIYLTDNVHSDTKDICMYKMFVALFVMEKMVII